MHSNSTQSGQSLSEDEQYNHEVRREEIDNYKKYVIFGNEQNYF